MRISTLRSFKAFPAFKMNGTPSHLHTHSNISRSTTTRLAMTGRSLHHLSHGNNRLAMAESSLSELQTEHSILPAEKMSSTLYVASASEWRLAAKGHNTCDPGSATATAPWYLSCGLLFAAWYISYLLTDCQDSTHFFRSTAPPSELLQSKIPWK